MKALTIRNIPNDLYRVIVKLAKRNRRSIQQQTLVILDRAQAFALVLRILGGDEFIEKTLTGLPFGPMEPLPLFS